MQLQEFKSFKVNQKKTDRVVTEPNYRLLLNALETSRNSD